MSRRAKKKLPEKISKGYRLLPETHELIYRIQFLLGSDLDTAISRACRKYFNYLKQRAK